MVRSVEKVVEALHAECIPQSTIDAIMARVRAKPRSGDIHWDKLRSEITEAMYAISSARTRWRVNRAPVYAKYLKLLHKVRDKIDKVREDNPSLPLSTITAQADALRRAHPDGDFPGCGQHWSSWVPPSIRARTEAEFDALYTAELLEHRDKRAKGTKVPFGSGRRLIPFGTASQRRTIDLKWERLRQNAQSHVDAYTLSIEPGAYPRTATVRALLLARHRAASKAVRVITALQQAANVHLAPDPQYMSPPTTWASPTILHKDEIDELRAAYRDAGHKGKITDMVGQPVPETPLA